MIKKLFVLLLFGSLCMAQVFAFSKSFHAEKKFKSYMYVGASGDFANYELLTFEDNEKNIYNVLTKRSRSIWTEEKELSKDAVVLKMGEWYKLHLNAINYTPNLKPPIRSTTFVDDIEDRFNGTTIMENAEFVTPVYQTPQIMFPSHILEDRSEYLYKQDTCLVERTNKELQFIGEQEDLDEYSILTFISKENEVYNILTDYQRSSFNSQEVEELMVNQWYDIDIMSINYTPVFESDSNSFFVIFDFRCKYFDLHILSNGEFSMPMYQSKEMFFGKKILTGHRTSPPNLKEIGQ